MIKETYYAVRIGMPGKHACYLMLREGCSTPQLFHCEKDAREKAADGEHRTPVKVEIREVK
jgi:hypothetical protein